MAELTLKTDDYHRTHEGILTLVRFKHAQRALTALESGNPVPFAGTDLSFLP